MQQASSNPADGMSCDLLIAGGGVVGLWMARLAVAQGMSVIVVDAANVGSGASGGILGALMPHAPERWNGKKQFQFDALVSLEQAIAELESETGLSTGYGRVGRLMPIPDERQRQRALEREAEAARNWQSPGAHFQWSVQEIERWKGWLSPEMAGAGVVFDDLSARLDPRALCRALKQAIQSSRHAVLIEKDGLTHWTGGRARLASGREVSARFLAVTAGHGSFPLLTDLFQTPERLGSAVKGQAALLDAGCSADFPLIFDDGVYVVPHIDGRIAIGSTSENRFDAPFSTDAQLDVLLDRARKLCPALEDAIVVERWAGLRPRAVGRDPLIDLMPGHQDVVVATGGFKITLGIAHAMAGAALGKLLDRSPQLPESFSMGYHLAKATDTKRG